MKLLIDVIKHHCYIFPPDRAADTNYKIICPMVVKKKKFNKLNEDSISLTFL